MVAGQSISGTDARSQHSATTVIVPWPSSSRRPGHSRCSTSETLDQLAGELAIGDRAPGAAVVLQDCLAITGGFGQPDATGDDRAKDLGGKKSAHFIHHLLGKNR